MKKWRPSPRALVKLFGYPGGRPAAARAAGP